MTRRRRRHRHRRAAPAASLPFHVAATFYAANSALGLGVATGAVRTGRFRWVHHALYIATTTTTLIALITGIGRHRRAALALLPTLVPLAVIPYAGTRTRRHPIIALSAAPCYLLAVLRTR